MLDMGRLTQSDTWTKAAPEIRPWLLMLWSISWQQTPCGAYSDDDELIAAKIGMALQAFQLNRGVLMRGWWKATDGRLYHEVVTERVLDLLGRREQWRKEKQHKPKTVPSGIHPDSARVPAIGVDLGFGSGLGPVGTVGVNTKRVRAEHSARASRLPAGWQLPDQWKAWAVEAHHLDPQQVVRISLQFRDHFLAAPNSKGGLKVDWLATWRKWIRKEVGDA